MGIAALTSGWPADARDGALMLVREEAYRSRKAFHLDRVA